MKIHSIIALLAVFSGLQLAAQSIQEKKETLHDRESDFGGEMGDFLPYLNEKTSEIQREIRILHARVWELYQKHSEPQDYEKLREEIREKREELLVLQYEWRNLASRENSPAGYGLWHAPDTTLEQLVIDYGAQDYVFLIPPDIGGIPCSITSNLPIPRASWEEMLRIILAQNGVGMRLLNPYLQELYFFDENRAHIRGITNSFDELNLLSPEARVCFVVTPEPSEVRRASAFLDKFMNHATTELLPLGRDLLLIGNVSDLQALFRLYRFMLANRGEKEYKVIPLSRVEPSEMARILELTFDRGEPIPQGGEGMAPPPPQGDSLGLKISILENVEQGIFLVGTADELMKAEEIVRNVENQVGDSREKTIFWYTAKHSDPEELADLLSRVYSLMITTGTGEDAGGGDGMSPGNQPGDGLVPPPSPASLEKGPPLMTGPSGFYQEGGFIVNPSPIQPRTFLETTPNRNRQNFLVDVKTGSIVMVVEASVLPKMKELIRKLDVPKKMVQIDTLLFEKVLAHENQMGMNLLRIGDVASRTKTNGLAFNNILPIYDDFLFPLGGAGITDFFISRKGGHSGNGAFDLMYRFLINQDDVQINSSPSVTTVNQTPATIAINEEISISTGSAFEADVSGRRRGDIYRGDSFTRAQYGTTISIKPTIHLASEEDDHENDEMQGRDYVDMETDVTFDTIHPSGHAERPDVTRRHITNQVQVLDGESVILGGLRRKTTNDAKESIPFLGELPGIGKLFSMTRMKDTSTEMYILITPHIIKDPKEQLNCLRQELLCLRPGDVPYFLKCLQEAHQYEKAQLTEGSLMLLLGRKAPHYYMLDGECCSDEGEYDGR